MVRAWSVKKEEAPCGRLQLIAAADEAQDVTALYV